MFKKLRLLLRMRRFYVVAAMIAMVAAFFGYRSWWTNWFVADDRTPVARISDKLADQVARAMPEIDTSKKLAVAPLEGKEGAAVAEQLAESLHDGKYDVVQRSKAAKVVGDFFGRTKVEDPDAARRFGVNVGARYVIYGRVENLVLEGDDRQIAAQLHLVDTAAEAPLLSDRFAYPAAGRRAATIAGGGRTWLDELRQLGAWLALILVLPLLFAYPIGRILSHRSNAANAVLLFFFIAVAGVLGWLIWLGPDPGPIRWTVMAFTLVGGLIYFGYFCRQVEEAGLAA